MAVGSLTAASNAVEAAPFQPKEIGRKFYADGRVRAFAGNTIISHLPQQGAGFAAFDQILNIYRALPTLGFARKITALPPSSYHMTVFSGPTDQSRETSPWPAGLPRSAPIADCNAMVLDRLKDFRMGVAPPFRMVVDDRDPPAKVSPITIHLRPADSESATKLRLVRDRIADAVGMRDADHDDYQHHITIAYQTAAFTETDQQEYEKAQADWMMTLRRNNVVFELGAPEYCVFHDMFAFQRTLTLPA
jgi:hypothetical protein